ncbi:MAG: cell division protein ZapA [Piscirickettsiaceae bacterium]|nr:MAG: cell division protein ZapA [Piscirickettsiaceae bacterium]
MPTLDSVTVTILDKDYQVSCPADERSKLESSARYLDQKMNDIRQSGRIVGLDRIAVMAGLNIAHDLLNEGDKKNNASLGVSEKIHALQNKLDFAINTFDK